MGAALSEDREDLAYESEATLDREIRVGGAAEVDALAAEVAPQAADFLDGVLFDQRPVAPGLLALGRVEGGGVAVGAAEAASPARG